MKLDIFRVLEALDKKDYGFYDRLDDEEKKGFSAFLALKWLSSVSNGKEMQHYYIAASNHYANTHLFTVSKHPKLQWLMLCAASPGVGKLRHEWIKTNKTGKTDNSKFNKLSELYPNYKYDDIAVLCEIISDKEVNDYLEQSGEKVNKKRK